MVIVVCLDDKNGILFNNRRQSSDRAVYKRIATLAENSRLFVAEYSASLFKDCDVIADNSFLKKANKGDICFVENTAFVGRCDIERIVVYRWNRIYPSDVFLPQSFFASRVLSSKTDFKGHSHPVITEEIYV